MILRCQQEAMRHAVVQGDAEPDHSTERGRAASVVNFDVTGRPRRSVPSLAVPPPRTLSPMTPIDTFDFAHWIARATQFVNDLPKHLDGEVAAKAIADPPMTSQAVETLRAGLSKPVPSALRHFLERGSAGFEFDYRWIPAANRQAEVRSALNGERKVCGKGEMCKATALGQWLENCRGWAEETWVADSEEDLPFWTQSFPFLWMEHGDYLALDCRTPSDNPPVVYLSHDDDSKVISQTFTGFLTEWARLGYVGPSSWLIEGFLDGGGMLTAETEQGKAFRRLLGDVG
jgi:hypothetical protein